MGCAPSTSEANRTYVANALQLKDASDAVRLLPNKQAKIGNTPPSIYHELSNPGKYDILATKVMKTQQDLSLAYSPGVAEPCLAIKQDPTSAYAYTNKGNTIACITNGTAVLGLGNIGALSSKPVMEGKAMMYSRFAGVTCVDLCVDCADSDEFVTTVKSLAPSYGGIHLEDIRAPDCFLIEERLQEAMPIPVLHGDQHATAVVVLAGLINALELAKKSIAEVKIVCNGAGAAGLATMRLLLAYGAKKDNCFLLDTHGVIWKGREAAWTNRYKDDFARETEEIRTMDQACLNADVLIGLSGPNAFTQECLLSMNPNPIIFALASPEPEVLPEVVKKLRKDCFVATASPKHPNQINDVLIFPYMFRAMLDCRASTVNDGMKLAAAKALAELAKTPPPDATRKRFADRTFSFGADYFVPSAFDPRLVQVLPAEIARAAAATGVAQRPVENFEKYAEDCAAIATPVPPGEPRRALPNAAALIGNTPALTYHEIPVPGKFDIVLTKQLETPADLALAGSPGVADPCLAVRALADDAYAFTNKVNMVACISNGTAVLGLGNIGALASKPVMEGKSVLFKKFAGINCVDICVDCPDKDDFIGVVKNLAPSFGGINLEDISGPDCFYVEEKLKSIMPIPVFHDDQHGTAIVCLAGLINALETSSKDISTVKVVCNGAGAAGIACMKLIQAYGVPSNNCMVVDTNGVIYKGRKKGMNAFKESLASEAVSKDTSLAEACAGADVLIGVSAPGAFTEVVLRALAPNPVIFAMANPEPEVRPEKAKEIRPDCIIATGRSDYPNQINNVMCFPFLFRATLDCRATQINEAMKMAAAKALANLTRSPVPDEVKAAFPDRDFSFGPDYIIPTPFDPRLIKVIPGAVVVAASSSGVAKKPIHDLDEYAEECAALIGAPRRINAMKSYGRE